MKNSRSLVILDKVTLKTVHPVDAPKNPNLIPVKDATRQAFHDAILEKKREVDEQVRFLQERIR